MMQRLAVAFLVAVAGCGGGGKPAPMPDMAPAVGLLCVDARADSWALPIVKTSKNGAFQVTLVASAASPPIIGDLTTWTLQVANTQGTMVANAAIAVKPWMPDHGHGTDVKATVSAGDAPGQYKITPLYLFMAGYWTITFTITNGAGVSDSVVYSVCLSDGT